jgi:ribose transport system permease protein
MKMQDKRTTASRTGGESEPRAHRVNRGARALVESVTRTPIVVMLIAVWVLFIFLNRMFFTANNMVTLVVVNSFFAVAAIGETFVLMTGGIDLSIAHNLTCSSIVSALLMLSFQTNAVNAIVNPGGPIVSLSELSALPGMDPQAIERALSATAGSTIAIGLVSAIAVGLLFGLLNGVAIGIFRMTPFIITLGTQLLARGISFVLSN